MPTYRCTNPDCNMQYNTSTSGDYICSECGEPLLPEEPTSGQGALTGMIAGGALGLAGGPVGVIIGGILGALLGDQFERESGEQKKQGRR